MRTGMQLANDYMFRAFFYVWVILAAVWAPFHFTGHYDLRVWAPTVVSVGLLVFASVKVRREQDHGQRQVWKATLRAYIGNLAALIAYLVFKPYLGHLPTLKVVGGVWLVVNTINTTLAYMAFLTGHDPEPD